MNSPRPQELDTLQRIQNQVQRVQEHVDTRLPRQYQHVTALVCGWKWRLATLKQLQQLTPDGLDAIVKRVRMEVGTFDYQAKEQGELLTRFLCDLDNILSYGNVEVKEARKALVVSIQKLLERADTVKTKAAKLKEFAERTVGEMTLSSLTEEPQVDSTTEEADVVMGDVTEEEAVPVGMHALFASEDEEVVDEEQEDEDADAEEMEEEEDDDEEVDEEGEPEETAQPQPEPLPAQIDVSSLPLWKPYYQLQQRPDGVYLLAKLQGVDPRHVQVQYLAEAGALVVSGFKLPTHKDIVLSRFSGVPTFGRFRIVQRVSPDMLNVEQATQQLLNDGTLQVRLPYHYVHHPRFYRRCPPVQPRGRLMVW
ncbi:hypothetical protein Poli38472_004415 [Pythium oligandrum]|uniref:BAG domain-containing protein n=1 Tax=Pythium oligandrum TaxID=41045 RepID=A0A8K1C9V6_PYTOL|nr:hypothetical protein Poli38472_004415 [Pythium oligandrum]|eukprot:TMW59346.1 hypothetical protein Poli38472_004415 [Pythium oligandrum]